MNAILAIPIELRLALLFVFGALAGSLMNLACYRLAWNQRAISPWSPAPKKAGPRSWADRVPIVGWLRMRRESKLHGAGFWISTGARRSAIGSLRCAAFYQWTCVERGLLFRLPAAPPPGAKAAANVDLVLHASCLAEIVLIWLDGCGVAD